MDGQGAGGEVFPVAGVALLGGVHHAAVHGAVALDPGHHDPHLAHCAPPEREPGKDSAPRRVRGWLLVAPDP
jgi:hypothetical protein